MAGFVTKVVVCAAVVLCGTQGLDVDVPQDGASNGTYGHLSVASTGSPPPDHYGDDTMAEEDAQSWPTDCAIYAANPMIHKRIREFLDWKIKLIEYRLSFPNYTYNPLKENITKLYRADTWARVSSTHGQTLLSLAFNYGVMSLMTLSFGVETLHVQLNDAPHGCFGPLSEDAKVETLLHLLMRDFQEKPRMSLVEEERICHEVIVDEGGFGRFRDRCCLVLMDRMHDHMGCTTKIRNIWLTILYNMLACVKVLVIFFGPSLFIPAVWIISNQSQPFVVKLKEPLKKRIMLFRRDTPIKATYEHQLDFRSGGPLPKLRKAIDGMPIGEAIETEISQYDILVGYSSLLTEYSVPVGLLQCLSRAIFFCKLQNVEPFKRCCQVNLFRSYDSERVVPWYSFWRRVGGALVLLLIPFPYYVRVFIYYKFENSKVLMRKAALHKLGLRENYDNSLVHYLGPTHGVFICIYLLYIVLALLMVFIVTQHKGRHLKKIVTTAFKDLELVSWMRALYMVVSNFIWPFERYGALGLLVAPFYWIVAMPISIVLAILFCLPATYVFFRMLVLATRPNKGSVRTNANRYVVERHVDESIVELETIKLIKDTSQESSSEDEDDKEDAVKDEDEEDDTKSHLVRPVGERYRNERQAVGNIVGVVLFIVALLSFLLVMAECLGFLIEMIVFTLMGIIVNAGMVLKYVSLLFIVIIYSYDCYGNVSKKYLNLNKGLFSEVKNRIKNLGEVTSLPAHLQENTGFKSVENSEQAEYESPDDISSELPRHWNINDLILFIDNEDTPRLPRQLFDEVCTIRVPGSPGPVYRSLLTATQDFFKMVLFLLFVFLIVLSFGAVYQVNSTNQTLATMAGGFLPLLMRNFMKPTTPDIEFGTVSFKSKLDEIIQNFQQNWPIFDFPFQLPEEEESDDEDSDSDSSSKKKDKNKDKDKNKKDKDKDKKDNDKKDKGKKDKDKKKKAKRKAESTAEADKDTAAVTMDAHTPQSEVNNNTTGAGLPQSAPSTSAAVLPAMDTGNESDEEEEEEEEEERKYDVDIALFLPEDSAEGWLEEWSEYEQYTYPPEAIPMRKINSNNKVPVVHVDMV